VSGYAFRNSPFSETANAASGVTRELEGLDIKLI